MNKTFVQKTFEIFYNITILLCKKNAGTDFVSRFSVQWFNYEYEFAHTLFLRISYGDHMINPYNSNGVIRGL